MVISSIDLKGGSVVQLKGGKDLVLKRDDADALIANFDKFGEVAVIDLDAALGNIDKDGNTVNTPLLKTLLRKGDVRTGGGVRTVERAKELVSLGAQKVIIGSMAWSASAEEGYFNKAFLGEVVKAIGKERVIVSVDAINGKIAVKGWTQTIDLDFLAAAKMAEAYCSEIFFTCVEREGGMEGGDVALASKLRSVVDCRVTIAGGISSVGEVAQLQKAGCDVQLGMSLYTNKVSLRDSFIACLNWAKSTNGLLPVIAQSEAGEVLMLGYANKEAIEKSFDSGKLTFFSRTRGELWTKGETSGHYLTLVRMRADCDRDTILATVIPHGNVCHTGSWTCFSSEAEQKSSLQRLEATIADRINNPTDASYTATLTSEKVREKISEEAGELVEAKGHDEVVWEAADLIYFVQVLLAREGVKVQEVLDELDRRHKK